MPQRPDSYDILNISTLEIARQMTLIDFDLFAKIKSTELVNQAWNKNGAKAPNICASIHRFNLGMYNKQLDTTIILSGVL
ncbi:hypothetical protein SARC_15584 [Sphaeroforma arctica JP610]|uniref:Ras-GEF domain-containing protein n=1 Tax=Sphaeroforma arctica JP610 TaxID=667725 RepID=A0A0L0F5L1_9EUKA|nr:hypothetical protein SARC_15584 [Sphaeroforma arctica JP610]KNC71871.1 hypothetical protein SARC_15584 [Sphaeroforma arctica JP610]|eukprot:XP_014145773.1 hypothetical protein SARC_15584 [Sphaeroforma arctica JP610]